MTYVNSGVNGRASVRAELFKPFLATPTGYLSNTFADDAGPFLSVNSGTNTASTSYDGFTVESSGAFTGTIRVYGYQNS
jgi:hypothetical protein